MYDIGKLEISLEVALRRTVSVVSAVFECAGCM